MNENTKSPFMTIINPGINRNHISWTQQEINLVLFFLNVAWTSIQ